MMAGSSLVLADEHTLSNMAEGGGFQEHMDLFSYAYISREMFGLCADTMKNVWAPCFLQ